MCLTCVTVTGVIAVASQVTPIEVLSDFTSSQKTLTSFTGSSSALSAKQRSEIKVLVDGSPEADAVVCTGLTLKGASRSVITTARNRAKASCDYAKRLNAFLETTVVTRTTSSRTNAGKVTVQVRTPKQEFAAPETPVTPLPKPGDVYSEPSEPSDSIGLCKIRESGPNKTRLPSGFSDIAPASTRTGNIKWALIPIDFPDLRGEANFRSRVDNQMSMLADWIKTVSEGKLTITWTVANNWFTLPGNSTEYAIGNSVNLADAPNGPKLFQDAMRSADPTFDFTSVQNVVFLLPKGQTFLKETSQGFPWDKPVIELVTNEGRISSYSIPGVFMDQPNKDYWGYWAHEFGHAISLPHIGSSRGKGAAFNGYDIMGNQDGPTKELSGWLRFVAEWLPDERVYCKNSTAISKFDLTLVPLNSSEQGLKMVVIPLPNSKALIVESRRDTKFSCSMTPSQNGVMVYTYDPNLAHGEDFLEPLTPIFRDTVRTPCPTVPIMDSVLRTGDKLTFEGITIENLSSGNFDKIRITK